MATADIISLGQVGQIKAYFEAALSLQIWQNESGEVEFEQQCRSISENDLVGMNEASLRFNPGQRRSEMFGFSPDRSRMRSSMLL